jgi:hypothetical protein
MRALARAPANIKAMVQTLSAAELSEVNDIGFWMWRNSDHRRANAENIQQIIADAVRVVASETVCGSPLPRPTLH